MWSPRRWVSSNFFHNHGVTCMHLARLVSPRLACTSTWHAHRVSPARSLLTSLKLKTGPNSQSMSSIPRCTQHAPLSARSLPAQRVRLAGRAHQGSHREYISPHCTLISNHTPDGNHSVVGSSCPIILIRFGLLTCFRPWGCRRASSQKE